MEYRYYITSAIMLLVLQLFIWNASSTIGWLFNLGKTARRWLGIISYLGLNSLLVVHFMRIVPLFRLLALILALLLFAFLVRLATVCFYHLSGKNKRMNRWLKVIYPFAFFALVGFSLYNAYVPSVVHYQVQIDKPLAKPLKIGVASDTHLGKWFGTKQLDQLAEIFKQQKVDLIFLPGDIMDDNLTAFRKEKMAPHLAKLQAPLGVYATLGNHDFFGAQNSIAAEIERAGIRVLWDQAVEIDGKFTIVGRNDDLAKDRPTAEQLLAKVNTALPVFLIDHRPTEIEQHSKLPIDLQLSGHTHKGQLFPANLITKMMYRLHYGYEKIGNRHFIVTSGYGFWGIPMRLGSQSEVVIVEVSGK